MNTPYPFVPDSKLAYVRRIDPADLPDAIRAQVPQGAPVWALHDAKGAVIALAETPKLAILVAEQNDLSAMSVH